MARALIFACCLGGIAGLALLVGCDAVWGGSGQDGKERFDVGQFETVWGCRGNTAGRLQKPRAMAIDADDRLYIVDMTARIQVFDKRGQFLRSWRTPASENGRPTGLSIGHDGHVLVADTHYYRVLVYSPAGKLLKTISGKPRPEVAEGDIPLTDNNVADRLTSPTEWERAGRLSQSEQNDLAGEVAVSAALEQSDRSGEPGFLGEPGQLDLVTDVVQDAEGNYYIAQMGEFDRIQKFSPDGEYLMQWGGHGDEPGHFSRPQSLAIDRAGHLWVADACNHRIQVFDRRGKLLKIWGHEGNRPGELYYPYDLVIADDATVYVCEYGNHRVQHFTPDGESLGCWGSCGRRAGQLYNPWALVRDSQGKIHVLDTNNHRVQCVAM